MRVLVLGGTRFVGRAIVEALLARGHEVTLFNRGSHAQVFPWLPRITGDRDRPSDVAGISGQRWDVIVDVSGYRPAQVRAVLDALGGAIPHYLYISTVSVYALPLAPDAGESAPLLQVDESIASADSRSYGGLKARCEAVLREQAESLTVLRPTVVIGARDDTDRFGWWVRRVANGQVPEPPRPGQPVQLIDVQDLAAFALRCVEQRILGTYNVVGPEEPLTVRGMIDTIAAALDVTVTMEPVRPGARLPLLLDDPAGDGAFQVSGAAARRSGLRLTPLAGSARVVFRWGR